MVVYDSVLSTVRPWKRPGGFTLVELMLAVLIAGILLAVGVTSYSRFTDQMKVTRAISDIYSLMMSIETFVVRNGNLPGSLADVGEAGLNDPWGNPYEYLRVVDADDDGKPGKGKPKGGHLRKDRSLHPVNTDYDLCSMGKDGKSTSAFTAQISQDDIVRANDGAFVGLVSDY